MKQIPKWIWVVVGLLFASLIGVCLMTEFTQGADQGDYASIAQYFAGHYSADVRTSHSMLYGLFLSPLATSSIVWMKVLNLLILFMIIAFTYSMSGGNKWALALIALSPVLWYMGPWVSPIPLASVLILIAWFNLEEGGYYGPWNAKFFAGMGAAMAAAVWDGGMFFALFLTIAYFYNKKMSDLGTFLLGALVGIAPLLMINQMQYGFALFSMCKYLVLTVVYSLYGAFDGAASSFMTSAWARYVAILITFPVFAWKLFFSRGLWNNNWKFKVNEWTTIWKRGRRSAMIFLTLSIVFVILFNPQIRYTLPILPIVIILLAKELDAKQFRAQIIISLLMLIVVMAPYVAQIYGSTQTFEATRLIAGVTSGTSLFPLGPLEEANMKKAITAIVNRYPNETFIVGPADDHYQELARLYWGNNVKEFVSIQDYEMWATNSTTIFEKTITFQGKDDRRQVWISGGIGANTNDKTNYSDIRYYIGIDQPEANLEEMNLKGFKPEGLYFSRLYLYEKEEIPKPFWDTIGGTNEFTI